MIARLFNSLSETEKTEAVKDLIQDSTARPEFFLMTGLSVVMATVGLLMNNAAVIIGSMLIAPILSPILSLSMGIVMADFQIAARSFRTLLVASGVSIGIAAVSTLFFPMSLELGDEVLSRTDPSLAYLTIAVVAGIAASFARAKPDMSESIPGIAISVALIPPLAVMGVGIARLNWEVASGSFLLFVMNVIGIVFASMIIFSLMNLYAKRNIASRAVASVEKQLAKEKADAEKCANGNGK
jgi:uncharacterized hydrophobic protein (TIGR00271 family)